MRAPPGLRFAKLLGVTEESWSDGLWLNFYLVISTPVVWLLALDGHWVLIGVSALLFVVVFYLQWLAWYLAVARNLGTALGREAQGESRRRFEKTRSRKSVLSQVFVPILTVPIVAFMAFDGYLLAAALTTATYVAMFFAFWYLDERASY